MHSLVIELFHQSGHSSYYKDAWQEVGLEVLGEVRDLKRPPWRIGEGRREQGRKKSPSQTERNAEGGTEAGDVLVNNACIGDSV